MRSPANKLSEGERRRVLETLHEPRFRDLPPEQVVAALADEDTYLCSPSTMYRYLRAEGEMAHRDSTRPAVHRRPREYVATGPQQVVSWDITYLRSPVRGVDYYLYLFVDIWSRKCLGVKSTAKSARNSPPGSSSASARRGAGPERDGAAL